jgi:hypothetical protein
MLIKLHFIQKKKKSLKITFYKKFCIRLVFCQYLAQFNPSISACFVFVFYSSLRFWWYNYFCKSSTSSTFRSILTSQFGLVFCQYLAQFNPSISACVVFVFYSSLRFWWYNYFCTSPTFCTFCSILTSQFANFDISKTFLLNLLNFENSGT